MLRQTQHEVKVDSIATKTATMAIEVEKNYKKNAATQKLILRHSKELKAKVLSRQKKIMSR